MAGCPADLFDEQHDGVAVAIKPDGLHLLHMPRRAAFMPQALAAAAVIMGFARFEGLFPCFGVHPRQHENIKGFRILRDGVVIHTGKISSLKRFKDDMREVLKGYECGVGIENFNDIKEGDVFEAFESVEEAATL